MWSKARHDEAQALYNAEQRGEQRGKHVGAEEERQKWQGVATENAELRAQLEALRTQLNQQ